jgi:aspartyl-tRNA(Asn)/glutamyl-tRNA(Gln) amidotransferase subunit B
MEGEYKITIGLEIHTELKTNSKMFCSCKNDPEETSPNVNICPVCMAYPGTLPVINKEAVRKVLLVGKAIDGDLADFTEFDRKNYFYPDIPKGYQISQYKYPLVTGGELNGVKITRVHLEEDTARSSHTNSDYSLVDYNRAGLPLMELVTEPVIHSKEEAVSFAKELQLLLQYLDVSDANMEKGQMRVEVNLSISKDDNFGTKVEIKNINSFKAVEKAIEYEYNRQKDLLDKGEVVLQETRGFNEDKQITFSQRSKENSKDYRYFPDPDLPKLFISKTAGLLDSLNLPELPKEKRYRYKRHFNIKDEDIETYINNTKLSKLFEESIYKFSNDNESIKLLSNYITSDLIGLIKSKNESNIDLLLKNIDAKKMSSLILMIRKGELSSRGAKDILKIMFEEGGNPLNIAKEKDLIQKNDPEQLKKIILGILDKNKSVVEDYKGGKESALQFFIGQAMKETKGSGNPEIIKKLILDALL